MSSKGIYSDARNITKELVESGLQLKGEVTDICLFQNMNTENIVFDAYCNSDEVTRLIKFNPSSNQLIVGDAAFKNLNDDAIIAATKRLFEIIDIHIDNVNLVRASAF